MWTKTEDNASNVDQSGTFHYVDVISKYQGDSIEGISQTRATISKILCIIIRSLLHVSMKHHYNTVIGKRPIIQSEIWFHQMSILGVD